MSKESKIRSLIDRKFLETIKEVIRLYGYQGEFDYMELTKFVEYLYMVCGVDQPNMKPHDGIDDLLTETFDKKEVTIEDVVAELKKCKTFIDFLFCVRNTFGLTMIWSKEESWLEYFGVEINGTRKKRFEKENELKDLILISQL